jgi:hypothetical protein
MHPQTALYAKWEKSPTFMPHKDNMGIMTPYTTHPTLISKLGEDAIDIGPHITHPIVWSIWGYYPHRPKMQQTGECRILQEH